MKEIDEKLINNLLNYYQNGFFKKEDYEKILQLKTKTPQEIGEFWLSIKNWSLDLPKEEYNKLFWFIDSILKFTEDALNEVRYIEEIQKLID